jgi:allophanate hydrolase
VSDLAAFAAAYAGGATASGVVGEAWARVDVADPVWISRVPEALVAERTRALDALGPAERAALPLFGIPFAAKDNIDVAGVPTTAGCPDFAYVPARSATVIERLEAAGAVVIGKTNLDQFATGLVGTRSPYGVPPNPFDERYIPGGSSSGSAVAVARGLVPFALGTDTAGSGRVPAGFTGTVGLKPTPGRISTAGVVPACRSLDCVSIFALGVDDAQTVFDAAAGFDARDPFSRAGAVPDVPLELAYVRIAVPLPEQREFFGDAVAAAAFERAIARLEALGAQAVPVDLGSCLAAARLLYEDAFVAERTAAFGDFADAHPDALLEVTRTIVNGGRRFSAVDAFRAQYRLRELRADAARIFAAADVLLVPTAPTIYTIEALLQDPFVLNARLGTYTNFVNFFDWCALAIPSERYPSGIPIGITLIGPTDADTALAALARRYLAAP